jgi:hypothetical protein
MGIGMLHHQRNDLRDQLVKQADAIVQLLAVDLAISGGAAMDELITQCVETIEDNAEQLRCIAAGEGLAGHFLASGQLFFPLGLCDALAVVIPEPL